MTQKDKFGHLTDMLQNDPTTKIYIDTCSLYVAVQEGCTFFDRLVPMLQDKHCKFDITHGTLEEIKAHRAGDDKELANTAERLEKLLAIFAKDRLDLVELVGRPGEYHDEAIQAKIRERARSFNQVYITNDLANAWDVYRIIVDSASVGRGLKQLMIYRITRKGDLVFPAQLPFLRKMSAEDVSEFFVLWGSKKYDEADYYLSERTSYRAVKRDGMKRHPGQSNSKVSHPERKDNPPYTPLPSSPIVNPKVKIVREGDSLSALRGAESIDVTLGKRINRGGEGFIFEAELPSGETGYLAKIYRRSKLKGMESACRLAQKVCHIVASRFGERACERAAGTLGDYVTFPLYVLVNEHGEFVGYLMRRADGNPLMHMVSNGAVKSEFLRLYPKVTKTDLVDICLNFLTVMRELHGAGIVVGDLNANNVLVRQGTWEVTLIDADSFQYGEAYPCDVAIERYTAPELLGRREGQFITPQNELFVIARILFETLMLVDNPYNSAVAEDPTADMRSGQFRYTFEFVGSGGERLSNREAPGEYYEIKWGQLSRGIKNALGNTFHCEGGYWEPGRRCSIDKWINLLREYRRELVQAVETGADYISNETFPTTRRKWITRLRCEICGQEGSQEVDQFRSVVFPEISGDDLLSVARRYHFGCYISHNGLVPVSCSKCGSAMGYGRPIRNDGKDYICQSCWERVECSSCGKLTPKWMLDERGWCGSCRKNERVKCQSCGRLTPRWVINKNGGMCDDCKQGVPTYCDCCGSYMGRLRPRSDGRKQYCEDCWRPAKCAACGWDNDGKLKRWMLDDQCRCRKCASRFQGNTNPSSRQAVSSQGHPTAKTGGKVNTTTGRTTKGLIFNRLFGNRKGI